MDIQNTIPLEPGGKDTCTPGRVFIGIRRACDNNLMFEDRVIAARGLGCTQELRVQELRVQELRVQELRERWADG